MTLLYKQKHSIIVESWFRISNPSLIITYPFPKPIIDVITAYSKIIVLQFCKRFKGKNIILSNNCKTAENKQNKQLIRFTEPLYNGSITKFKFLSVVKNPTPGGNFFGVISDFVKKENYVFSQKNEVNKKYCYGIDDEKNHWYFGNGKVENMALKHTRVAIKDSVTFICDFTDENNKKILVKINDDLIRDGINDYSFVLPNNNDLNEYNEWYPCLGLWDYGSSCKIIEESQN